LKASFEVRKPGKAEKPGNVEKLEIDVEPDSYVNPEIASFNDGTFIFAAIKELVAM
jgi:hypothetical protein